MTPFNRRSFLKTITTSGIAMGALGSGLAVGAGTYPAEKKKKIGIIGLDTSHAPAFTRFIHDPEGGPELSGFEVTAAYPYGSRTVESSYSRIPGFIKQITEMGVDVVDSVKEVLERSDFILLLTNDGHPRLEQALQVMEAGKSMFVDKPATASLTDTIKLFEASRKYGVPIFSSSGLRYLDAAQAVRFDNKAGEVLGADAFCPALREETHPDLFWYGIHGVEILYTVLGTGCKELRRIETSHTDIVTGKWDNDVVGVLRGMRKGSRGYGGTAFGTDAIVDLGPWRGYRLLVVNILEFFRTGKPPVSAEETIELFAFMEAADESKRKGGKTVEIESVLSKAGG